MGTHPQDPLPHLYHTLFSKNTAPSSTVCSENTLSWRTFQSGCFLYHFLPPTSLPVFFFSSSFSAPTPSLLACPGCVRTGTKLRALIIMISCGALWLQLYRARMSPTSLRQTESWAVGLGFQRPPPPCPGQNLVRIILPVFLTASKALCPAFKEDNACTDNF